MAFATVSALLIAPGVIAGAGVGHHAEADLAAEALAGLGRWSILLGSAILTVAVLLTCLRRGWLTLRDGDPLRASIAPWLGAAFVGLLVSHVLGSLAIRLVGTDVLGTEDPVAPMALATLFGYLAQVPIAVAIVVGLPRSPLSTTAAIRIGLLGLLLVAPVIVTVSGLAGVLDAFFRAAPPPLVAHETLRTLLETPPSLWTAVLTGGVLLGAPIFEEIAYRGALQGAFRAAWRPGAIRPWMTIVATSLVFVLMHVPAIPEGGRAAALSGLFVLSLALGVLRERTGGLLAPIVAHAAFNGANLLLARVVAL